MKLHFFLINFCISLLLEGSGARITRECAKVQWRNETFFQPNNQREGERLPGQCLPGPVFFSHTGQKYCLARTAGENASLMVCNNRSQTYRLPQNLRPSKYRIKLYVFLTGNRTEQKKTEGELEIDFRCYEPTSQIVFHVDPDDITIDRDSVEVTDKSNLDPIHAVYQHQDKLDIEERLFYVIGLNRTLEKGQSYSLKLKYLGLVHIDPGLGLFLSDDWDGGYMAVTQFQWTNARTVLPCFDEPAMKATFQLTLGRPEEYGSISNMPQTQQNPGKIVEGVTYVEDVYQETVNMSIYTLAFVISKYKFLKEEGTNGFEFRTWYRPNKLDQVTYTHQAGMIVLKKFEDFFGVDYPLPKMDMIGIPEFRYGAMENWGLVTYNADKRFVYDASVMTEKDKYDVLSTVAHELAHMWFGNLVTMSWWHQTWLNEGFANYFELVGADLVEEGENYMELFQILTLHKLFTRDIGYQITSPDPSDVQGGYDIGQRFKWISYLRGGSLIRMMTDFLSISTFKAGLTNYLNEYKYKSVVQDDLFKVLDDQARGDGINLPAGGVKEVMDTWTRQPCYPLLTVKRERNSVVVTQDIYRSKWSNSDDKYYMWWVPLKYITIIYQTGKNNVVFGNPQHSKTEWLGNDGRSKRIDVPHNKVFVLNYQQMGYYRVNYDEKGWGDIILCLRTDHTKINPQNRAQILDDSYELMENELMPVEQWKKIHEYLIDETEYLPWSVAIKNLQGFYNTYEGEQAQSLTEDMKTWILSLLDPYLSYHIQNFEKMTSQNIKLKAEMFEFACNLNNSKCTHECTRQFREWMDKPDPDINNPILPDLQKTVFVHGILNGLHLHDFQAMVEFFDARLTFLRRVMKNEVWHPNLDRMVYAHIELKEKNILSLYTQSQNYKINEYLDAKLMKRFINRFINRTDDEERSAYIGDPPLDFIIENWDSVVLNIKGKRQGIFEFLHEIFGDIFTAESIERMEYFRENNDKLKEDSLAMLDVLIERGKEKHEMSQRRMPAIRNLFSPVQFN